MENTENTKIILLAEERPASHILTTRMLESLGCEVIYCDSHNTAPNQSVLKKLTADLVFLDIDELQCIHKQYLNIIKARNFEIPIIISIRFEDHKKMQFYLDEDTVEMIEKPFDLKKLAWVLGNALCE